MGRERIPGRTKPFRPEAESAWLRTVPERRGGCALERPDARRMNGFTPGERSTRDNFVRTADERPQGGGVGRRWGRDVRGTLHGVNSSIALRRALDRCTRDFFLVNDIRTFFNAWCRPERGSEGSPLSKHRRSHSKIVTSACAPPPYDGAVVMPWVMMQPVAGSLPATRRRSNGPCAVGFGRS